MSNERSRQSVVQEFLTGMILGKDDIESPFSSQSRFIRIEDHPEKIDPDFIVETMNRLSRGESLFIVTKGNEDSPSGLGIIRLSKDNRRVGDDDMYLYMADIHDNFEGDRIAVRYPSGRERRNLHKLRILGKEILSAYLPDNSFYEG